MSQENLSHTESIKKMQEFAEDINICLFCTKVDQMPFETRPMATQKVDDEGVFWFLSGAESHKNFEIKENDTVQLLYAKGGDYHYMTVTGKAFITRDRKIIDEMWTNMAKAWFKEGKDDPSLTVIGVRPTEAYYWDTKHGKMVSFFKIAAAMVTGNFDDGGKEGKLTV